MKMQRLTPADYDSIPRFKASDEPVPDVAARSLNEVAPLCLAALAAIAIGLLAIRRYRVTG